MSTLTSKVQTLLTYANGISGKEDTTLGDAVHSLADGFGGGGLKTIEGTFIPTENINSPTFTLEDERFAGKNIIKFEIMCDDLNNNKIALSVIRIIFYLIDTTSAYPYNANGYIWYTNSSNNKTYTATNGFINNNKITTTGNTNVFFRQGYTYIWKMYYI